MDKPPINESIPDLQSVAKQFEHWRANRQKRDRIPQHLWHAAAQLCKNHSATRVSRYLRLSFTDLKKHLPAGKNASPVRFMQIDFSRPNGNWQLCCQRGDGANFTVCANGPLPDIERLIEKFLP